MVLDTDRPMSLPSAAALEFLERPPAVNVFADRAARAVPHQVAAKPLAMVSVLSRRERRPFSTMPM